MKKTANEDLANDAKWMKKTDVELLHNLENATMDTTGTALYSLIKSFFNLKDNKYGSQAHFGFSLTNQQRFATNFRWWCCNNKMRNPESLYKERKRDEISIFVRKILVKQ